MHVFRRDDRVRPLDGFLDLGRVNPMPGNMAHIMQIPIEALYAIQHYFSIYNYCIYKRRTKNNGNPLQRRVWLRPKLFICLGSSWANSQIGVMRARRREEQFARDRHFAAILRLEAIAW